MSLKRGTLAIFLSTIIRNLLSFGAVAFFSRAAGVGALGTFFLFQSLISMLSIPADIGLRRGIEKRLSEGEPAGNVIGSALALKAGLLTVLTIAILALQGPINSYIGGDVATLLVIGLVLNELGQVGKFTLRGEQRVSKSAFFEPLRTAVWLAAGVLLIEYNIVGSEALLYGYLAALLVVSLVAIWRTESPIGRPSISRIKSLVGYSKFAAIGTVGGLVYNWADVFLIGFFLTQTAVGAYEVAWRVATASLLLSNAVRVAVFPQANQWSGEGAYEELESLIQRAFIPSLYLVIPAFVGVVILGEEIISVGFAIEFQNIHLVLIILMVEKVQRSVLLVLIAPMHAVGRVDLDAYTTILGVIVNIGLNLLLIPQFGILGAAVGTTSAATINTLTHGWYLSRKLDIRAPMSSIVWCGVSALAMGFILFGALEILSANSLPSLGLLIGIAGVSYVCATFLSDTIRGEILTLVNHGSN